MNFSCLNLDSFYFHFSAQKKRNLRLTPKSKKSHKSIFVYRAAHEKKMLEIDLFLKTVYKTSDFFWNSTHVTFGILQNFRKIFKTTFGYFWFRVFSPLAVILLSYYHLVFVIIETNKKFEIVPIYRLTFTVVLKIQYYFFILYLNIHFEKV